MNGKVKHASIIILLVSILLFSLVQAVPVEAQAPSISITQVFWGDQSQTVQAKPGDRNIPLSVEIQNIDTVDITSMTAKLELRNSPFTSQTGEKEALAGYPSTLSPGKTGTLRLVLNIDGEAKLGSYNLPLQVETRTARYLTGVTSSLTVPVPLYGEVSFSVYSQTDVLTPGLNKLALVLLNTGDADAYFVDVSVSVPSPLVIVAEDNRWLFKTVEPSKEVSVNMTLFAPSTAEGYAYLAAVSLSYRDAYGFTRSASSSVGLIVKSTEEVFNTEIQPGVLALGTNSLSLSVVNDGDTSVSSVDVTLSIPQPLTLIGKENRWYYRSISQRESVTFETQVYAPTTAVGSAYQASVSISYDIRESRRTEIKTLGLVVGNGTVQPGEFSLVQLGWGDLSRPTGASPGDKGVTLSAMVQNLSNNTVTGLNATLHLSYPFTNTTDGNVATAYTSLINPAQTGVLQFTLNISPEARLDVYPLRMVLNYLIRNDLSKPVTYVSAPDVELSLPVPLHGRSILKVETSGNEMVAGTTNMLNFVVENIGTAEVLSLDVTLTLPSAAGAQTALNQTASPTASPMILARGDNYWHFDSVKPRSSVSFTAQVTTSNNIVGTYQLGLTLSYRDGWGHVFTEMRTVGLSVSSKVPSSLVNLKSYSITPEPVRQGDDFTLSLSLDNLGESTAQTVTVQLLVPTLFASLSPSVVSVGDLQPGSGSVVNYNVIASPSAAAGVVHTFEVDIYYVDSLGLRQVTRNLLGVPLHGTIELVVYDVSVFPSPAPVGGEFTVSLTLLNRGTVSAMYTNVTYATETPFESTVNSVSYLGEVSPNAPAPLSITVQAEPGVVEGVYPLKLLVSYRDEYNVPHVSSFNVPVSLAQALPVAEVPSTQGLLPSAMYLWIVVVAVVVVAAAVSVIYVKGKRKK